MDHELHPHTYQSLGPTGTQPHPRPHCPSGLRPNAVLAPGRPHPRRPHSDTEGATASGGSAAFPLGLAPACPSAATPAPAACPAALLSARPCRPQQLQLTLLPASLLFPPAGGQDTALHWAVCLWPRHGAAIKSSQQTGCHICLWGLLGWAVRSGWWCGWDWIWGVVSPWGDSYAGVLDLSTQVGSHSVGSSLLRPVFTSQLLTVRLEGRTSEGAPPASSKKQ